MSLLQCASSWGARAQSTSVASVRARILGDSRLRGKTLCVLDDVYTKALSCSGDCVLVSSGD